MGVPQHLHHGQGGNSVETLFRGGYDQGSLVDHFETVAK